MVAATRDGAFTDEVVAHFDIVGFDPRGVGASEPAFACGDPGEQIAAAVHHRRVQRHSRGNGGRRSGRQSVHPVDGARGRTLHTEYVARDMDEIRQALGAEQIS